MLQTSKSIMYPLIPLTTLILALGYFGEVLAQSLPLVASKTTVHVGESTVVTLNINTGGRSINTISGIVDVPLDKFQISDLRYGNSILSLWVEKPSIDYGKGLISFSGGIPGGFNGVSGPILTFVLKAKNTGSTSAFVKEVKVLLNDGLGTELSGLATPSLAFTINPAPPKPKVEPKEEPKETIPEIPPTSEVAEQILPPDTIIPEHFIPMFGSHPDVADGDTFVSFFAVDKDTGIDHYEVREEARFLGKITERWNTSWMQSESLYILKSQFLPMRVTIRAYDQAGNVREVATPAPFSSAMTLLMLAGLMLLATATTFLFTRYFYTNSLFSKT